MQTETLLDELDELIDRHCNDGIWETPLPRVVFVRADSDRSAWKELYYPLLCVVTSGEKRSALGSRSFVYERGTSAQGNS